MAKRERPCTTPGCKNKACGGAYRCSTCRLHDTKSGAPKPPTIPTPTFQAPANTTDSIVDRPGFDRVITKAVHERVRTLDDLVRVCEIDLSVWRVVEWSANKWEVGMKVPATTEWVESNAGKDYPAFTRYEAEPVVVPLYQIKARLQPRTDLIAAKNEIEELKAIAKQEIVKPWRGQGTWNPPTGNMLELDIFDLHLGKLAWKKETGYQNYDLKLARAEFETALMKLLERTAHYTFDEILFPIGNDFFHTDNLVQETAHGTRQDMDGRFHKSARIGREMITWATDVLRTVAPKVVLTVVPGNHDQLTAWHLGDSLECWYHRDLDVEVHNEPTLRKFYEFGKVMLMFTHGNRGKQYDLPNLMATEQPEMWGRTRYREIHLGHLHKTQVQDKPSVNENFGVRTRILSALCATDAWHSEMQFVGNLRAAEAFVWNKDEGLLAQATYITPAEK